MFKVALNQLRKWGSTYRIYVVLAAIFAFTLIRTEPVRSYAASMGLGVTPYFGAFQMSDGQTRMLFFFGLILLLCNAPFTDGQQMLVLARTGRRKWFMGEMLYILLSVMCYFLIVMLAPIPLFLPWIAASARWGTVFELCAKNNTLAGVLMPGSIVESYSPLQACIIVYCLNVGVGMLFGLVIFYGNLFKSRIYGRVFAMGWVVVSELAASDIGLNFLRYISPATWAGVSILLDEKSGLGYPYAVVFLIAGCLLFAWLIMRKSRHYTIEALEEF